MWGGEKMSSLPDEFTALDLALWLGKTSAWTRRIISNMLAAGVVRAVGENKYRFVYTRKE